MSWRKGARGDLPIPAFVVDEDRWAALSGGTDTSGTATGVAASIGAETFCDARGIPTVAPVPTLADPAVWRIPGSWSPPAPRRRRPRRTCGTCG
ncbi:hypothetical protein D3C59_33280 [Streptomyces sp. SHP22-7]|nr:hypothetical protein D3C59_33280 [Streptomyces sp. SHP22-7]